LARGCLIWETARPYFYARGTADGRAIIGGEDISYSDDHRRDGLVAQRIELLGQRFQRLFPDSNFIPAFGRAGTFGETKDGLPYIRSPASQPQAFFALGYGGNGITFSMIAARLIRDLYLGLPNADAEVFGFSRLN
jgi:glycine/D-amino acid oxidase-like deaminating enzyme